MAGALVGQARVVLGVESDRFNRDLERSRQQFRRTTSGMERDTKRASLGISRSIKGMAAGFLGAGGAVYALKSAVDAASNLNEQQAKATVVFGQSSRAMIAWSKTTSRSIGIASDQALEAAGTFGAMLRPLGLAPDRVASMSKSLVKLSADLASFNNARPEDTMQALRSGIAGETEPLRRFGILLSEARVKAEALRATGKESEKQLTAQEKAMARYRLILKDANLASGDFERTSGSLANQQRIMRANLRELQIELGTALVPAVKTAVTWLNKQIEAFREGKGEAGRFKEDLRGMVQSLRSIAKAANGVARAFGGWDDVARVALAAFAVSKMFKLAAAVRGIGTAAYFSAGGLRAMGAAGAGAGVAGGAGRGRRSVGAIPIGAGAVGTVAALVLSGQIGLPGGLEIGNAREKIVKAQELYRVDKQRGIEYARKHGISLALLDPDFAAAEAIVAPGEGRRRPRGGKSGKRRSRAAAAGGAGDGLSAIQRLEIDAGRAELTAGLGDDLAIAKKIAAYYRYRERTTKKTGDELFAIKQDTIAAEQRLTAILQQIEDNATREQEKRAAAARKAAEKRARRLRDQAAKAKSALPGSGPYANTSSGFNKAGVPVGKVKKERESGTGASAAAQIRDFLVRWQEMQGQYGPNIRPPVTVNQTFSSTAPLATVDELARSARYAAFHFRHSLAG